MHAVDAIMTPAPKPSTPPLTAADEDATASALLALAERVVHWEDDVSREELRYYAALYAQVEQKARAELALLTGSALPLQAAGAVHPDAAIAALRGELLAQRAQVTALMAQLERARSARLKRPRWVYPSLWLAVFLAAVSGAAAAYRPMVELFDLGNVSAKKPWRASSGASPSMPLHGTLDTPLGSYFFFTANEHEPWLEIDLQRETTIRSATVRNRDDCCEERAVPLVLESSVDRKHWQMLGVQLVPFEVWRPRFAGTRARWVRLRVQAESTLHLHSVIVRTL